MQGIISPNITGMYIPTMPEGHQSRRDCRDIWVINGGVTSGTSSTAHLHTPCFTHSLYSLQGTHTHMAPLPHTSPCRAQWPPRRCSAASLREKPQMCEFVWGVGGGAGGAYV